MGISHQLRPGQFPPNWTRSPAILAHILMAWGNLASQGRALRHRSPLVGCPGGAPAGTISPDPEFFGPRSGEKKETKSRMPIPAIPRKKRKYTFYKRGFRTKPKTTRKGRLRKPRTPGGRVSLPKAFFKTTYA